MAIDTHPELEQPTAAEAIDYPSRKASSPRAPTTAGPGANG
jgi:hypothetical protein